MSNNDPFSPPDNPGHTLIKPMPGGAAFGQQPPPSQPPPPPQNRAPAEPVELPVTQGLNRMENAASHLFGLVIQLKAATSSPNVAQLRTRINQELQQFESALLQIGYERKIVKPAHYCMCTLIDEVILSTPWGGQSDWRANSLLVAFHNDAWGGDAFFTILERASQNPGGNRDLLEYLYICLALGFEGKYAPLPDGQAQLARVREELYQVIRANRPEFERELSSQWRPQLVKGSALARYIPLWALAAVCAGVLMLTYLGFWWSLNSDADPLMTKISLLDGRDLADMAMPTRSSRVDVVDFALTLRQALKPEIDAGKVKLDDKNNAITVLLVGDTLFASGSARIQDDFEPVLVKIGEALVKVPGRVLVTGHTDNVPMSRLNARFQSNWDLSQARADTVMEFLLDLVGEEERFSSAGRADTEPFIQADGTMADNSTVEGRAKNRRVEIVFSPRRPVERA